MYDKMEWGVGEGSILAFKSIPAITPFRDIYFDIDD
jgi:hypothetical protein